MDASNSTTRLVLLTIALGLGTFMQILDTSVANVAIAYIAGDLAVSADDGTWVITSFSISNGLILILTGWLSKRFGGVKLFIWSTILFSFTSWLCGLAEDLASLVTFRILQGASGGVLIPLSQSLLIAQYPPDKKGTALGFWGMIVIVAPIVGPVVGGYITYNYSWPWIFYINIPIGLLSAWMTWVLLGKEKEITEKTSLDVLGFVLLTMGICCLQVFLDKGNDLDWLQSPFMRVMLITAIVSFLFFIPWNYYSARPIVNFALFKYRNFTISTFVTAIAYVMFFGTTVLFPLWLVTEMNYTADWAGLVIMPMGIIPLLTCPVMGRILDAVDGRLFVAFCFLAFSFTFFWLSYIPPDVDLQHLLLIRVYQGLGLNFIVAMMSMALAPIPTPDLAAASGIFNFIRLIAGGGFGTSIYVTLWEHRAIFHHSRLIENITPYRLITEDFYAYLKNTLSLAFNQANVVVDMLIEQQAYILAINDLFWATGWVFLLLVPWLWLCEKVKKDENKDKKPRVIAAE